MTTQKDFKRLVRGRMQKTGETYTAARARLLRRRAPGNGQRATGTAPLDPVEGGVAPAVTPPAEFARLAGMSDEKLKEKTGCAWDRWVWALDEVNAQAWPHGEIARYVHEKYKVPGWWSQAVTVGYERIKGLRAIGQRRSGSWSASKSRTIAASVSTVFKAVRQPKLRSAWLPGVKVAIRTAVPNKSVRLTWEDGSSVEVYLVSKARSKTQVAVEHTRLADRAAVDRMKAFWTEHLGALAELVERKKS